MEGPDRTLSLRRPPRRADHPAVSTRAALAVPARVVAVRRSPTGAGGLCPALGLWRAALDRPARHRSRGCGALGPSHRRPAETFTSA